jgi:hypothetical protein
VSTKKPDANELTTDLDALAAENDVKAEPISGTNEPNLGMSEASAAAAPAPPAEEVAPQSEKAPVPEGPLPAHLADRAAALQELTTKLQAEIEAFKSGQAYLDGDVPVYLDSLGGSGVGPTDRRVGWIDPRHLDSRYSFRWCNKQMVDYHRAKQRWTVQKKDFDLMVRARGGEYTYGANAEGHVICGDLVLMATTQEINAALMKKVRDKTRRGEGRARGGLRKLGDELGMEVTGDDDVGPKIQKIMSTISRELGPDALKIFQGNATR